MEGGRKHIINSFLISIAALAACTYPPQQYPPPSVPYPPQEYPPYPPLEPYKPAPTSYAPKPKYGNPYSKCDPYERPLCAQNSSLPYCLEDPEYPLDLLMTVKVNNWPRFMRLYADITIQSANDLIEGVTKDEESAFDYSFYTGANTFDITHWAGPAGYICPSDVKYAMPRRAINAEGQWRIVYNDGFYHTQTVRMETCLFPDSACRLLAPCYSSKCKQKYIYHRMISWDPCDPYKGLFLDIYRFPSACSCHVPTAQ